jgi:PST family polysaccharide transporter
LGAQSYRAVANFAGGIILAHLLTPEDFGLVAIAYSCIALVGAVQDLGLHAATIQRPAISLREISGLFWISAGSGLIFAVVLTLLAPGVAWLFGDERLRPLMAVFAVTVAAGGFQSQLLALMNRQFRFKALAVIDVLAATTGVIAGLMIAWLTSSWSFRLLSEASLISCALAFSVDFDRAPRRLKVISDACSNLALACLDLVLLTMWPEMLTIF